MWPAAGIQVLRGGRGKFDIRVVDRFISNHGYLSLYLGFGPRGVRVSFFAKCFSGRIIAGTPGRSPSPRSMGAEGGLHPHRLLRGSLLGGSLSDWQRLPARPRERPTRPRRRSSFDQGEGPGIVLLPTGFGKAAVLMTSAYSPCASRALVVTPSFVQRKLGRFIG